MSDVPEGRCKGQARARKAEATMLANGTSRPKGRKMTQMVYGEKEKGQC
jgi:hypothetical protein